VVDGWAAAPAQGAENPTDVLSARAIWPTDPLGSRRPALEEAAGLIRAALTDATTAEPVLPGLAMSDTALDDEETRRWDEEVTMLLAERDRLAALATEREVSLPEHLTVSQLVALRQDPVGLARTLRRPMPTRPDPYARRGTAFHAWLEQRYEADRLLDLDELPGAADEDAAPDDALVRLQQRFLASEWADRVPVEVEVPFATEVGGVMVRGRMDAVFRDGDGGFDVVDWKTGHQPASEAAAEAAAVQLAAYRLAWAALAGVPVEKVRAAFHYVADGVTVRPADLLDAGGLAALVTALPEPAAS
jgi:ATP-dependent DNA helicase UvrD/PcrA